MSGHLVLLAVVWMVLAVVVGFHASNRGRSGFLWGTFTFFAGIFGVVVYLLVVLNEFDDPERACPECSTKYTGAPAYCSNCGEPIDAEEKTRVAQKIRSGPRTYCSDCNSRVGFDADRCPSCGGIF